MAKAAVAVESFDVYGPLWNCYYCAVVQKINYNVLRWTNVQLILELVYGGFNYMMRSGVNIITSSGK